MNCLFIEVCIARDIKISKEEFGIHGEASGEAEVWKDILMFLEWLSSAARTANSVCY